MTFGRSIVALGCVCSAQNDKVPDIDAAPQSNNRYVLLCCRSSQFLPHSFHIEFKHVSFNRKFSIKNRLLASKNQSLQFESINET